VRCSNPNDPHAREALALFRYRVGRELGSLAAAFGGLHAMVSWFACHRMVHRDR
jgi:hypothetical protein